MRALTSVAFFSRQLQLLWGIFEPQVFVQFIFIDAEFLCWRHQAHLPAGSWPWGTGDGTGWGCGRQRDPSPREDWVHRARTGTAGERKGREQGGRERDRGLLMVCIPPLSILGSGSTMTREAVLCPAPPDPARPPTYPQQLLLGAYVLLELGAAALMGAGSRHGQVDTHTQHGHRVKQNPFSFGAPPS